MCAARRLFEGATRADKLDSWTSVGKYANILSMRPTRAISWLKAARKEFEKFPAEAQATMLAALTIAAEGGKADIAKPFKGVDGGVWEIALKHRGDAYRTIYAVQLGLDLIVIDAFQKKSKSGIKTPQVDVDRIKERIRRLKESL